MSLRPTAALALLLAPLPARAWRGADDTWVWRGVDEADGPPYSHLELGSLGGTDLGLGTGDSATLTLPFAFPFYGTSWTEVTVHSGGVISMGSGANDPGSFAAYGGCVADGTSGLAFVAPLWDDWDLDLGGAVYAQAFPGALFVQWDGVWRDASTTSTQDFGVWLYATGEVAFVWEDLWGGTVATSYGRLGAVGVQAGAEGVSLDCATGGIDLTAAGVTFTPWGVGHLSGAMESSDWADAVLDGSGASDRFGWALCAADLTGDGLADLAVGAPYDDDGASNAGAAWIFSGADLAGDLGPGDATAAVLGAAASNQVGAAIHGGGDLDGDGLADLAIGAPGDSAGAGAAVLFLGGALAGTVSAGSADAILTGERSGDAAGTRLVQAGDLDGDGYDDLGVAAPAGDGAATDAGQVYVFLGGSAWADGSLALADAILRGEAAGDGAGGCLAGVGDVDGDGLADLLIGASGSDALAADGGAAYLVAGADLASGTASLSLHTRLEGAAGDAAGQGVAAGPDIDGDGLGGILVGSYMAGSASEGSVAFLEGAPSAWSPSLADADAILTGAPADRLGYALAALDLGDGAGGLAAGAYGNSDGASVGGAILLVHGDTLATGDDTAWGALIGADAAGYLGAALDVGDVDGDGYADLAAGAWGASGGAAASGRVVVVLSRPGYPDADGDGFVASFRGGPDCDDDDAGVGPHASETCDGADEDCDGDVDEDWGDTDGDGTADCRDAEECDGLDNDGDGLVDEAMPDADGDGTCDALDAEDCDGIDNDGDGDVDEDFPDTDADGIADCLDVEECDGLDNDGDGVADEGYPDADRDGIADCADRESCDGLDNDGDGLVDETYPDSDRDGEADCLDEEECDDEDNDGDGEVDEDQPDADGDGLCDDLDAEDCDGIDNDGDGHVDEDFPDTDRDGTPDCRDVEDCDGLDNDGDGTVDEDFPDGDADGTADCVDAEDCDGLDNDGDGLIDETFPDTDRDGTPDCLDSEDCDGLDNDGDGAFDEGFADVDGDGVADCVEVEECDGVDNDGDGLRDEDFADVDGDGVADCVDHPGDDTGLAPGPGCQGCASGGLPGGLPLALLGLLGCARRRRAPGPRFARGDS